MRIAIVDDIASERLRLHEQLTILLCGQGLEAQIFEYESGEDFLLAAKKKAFSLVFLDIYMKGTDGVETAKELRSFDGECILVFTTTSVDHALDGFRVRATQYLVKPYSDETLKEVFDEIMKRFPAPNKYIEVRASGSDVRVKLKDIVYAEHYQHQIYIYTTMNKHISTRMTFKDFSALLADEKEFFPCGRGVLVNLSQAVDFDGKEFLLKDGRRLGVSRNLSQEARRAFGDYLFNRGRG